MKSLILGIIISLTFPFSYFSFGNILTFQEESHKSHKIRKYEDLAEKEEFRQSYKLEAGAKVDISDISGILEIETIEGDTAEVYIVRSARDRKDLEVNKTKVENNGRFFRIFTESHFGNWNNRETRQRIYLKLPKQVDLTLSDISGFAEVGEIQGTLKVNDISGSLRIDQATNCKEINDISGSVYVDQLINCEQINDISGHVEIGIQQIPNSGLNIHDISGNVNLKFADDVNANLKVRDISGNVSVNLPNWTIIKKYDRSNFEGRIGSGGTLVNISDISGAIRLSKQSPN
jgi:Putative adhesin